MLGVDTGGTFTDFVFVKDGHLEIVKLPSTPHNPAEAIMNGVGQKDHEGHTVARVIHGTTVATNAILERKGAKTALITNKGLEHLLLIGRQDRPDLYAAYPNMAAPLIPRDLCFGVSVRRNVRGEVITPLNDLEVKELIAQLKEQKVEAVVVGLIHSYQCGDDEMRVGELFRDLWPEVPVSLSCEILPTFREVERLMTSAMNAYVAPKVAAYVDVLRRALASRSLYLMQSNGGTLLPKHAQKHPIRLALSGPAGGVVAAFHLAQEVLGTRRPHILTIDMGGTSTDVALCPGRIPIAQHHEMNGLPMALPAIDIHTVGAGGGSLVTLDSGGALKVGPQSAGAVPGPVCYGKGGAELTVTDANLFLGRLRTERSLGTDKGVSPDAEKVSNLMCDLANKMCLSTEAVAQGIIDVVDEHMIHALSKVSIQQGFNPQDFALVPFGGAGPLHMCALAEKLGIKTIIVPQYPGVFSALGLVMADHLFDATISVFISTEAENVVSRLEQCCEDLKSDLQVYFAKELHAQIRYEWTLHMRYEGQSHELAVPLAKASRIQESVSLFHERHTQMNGWQKNKAPQIVSLTGRAVVAMPKVIQRAKKQELDMFKQEISVYDHQWYNCEALSRESLNESVVGPKLLLQQDATAWVALGWHGYVDKSGALVLRREEFL